MGNHGEVFKNLSFYYFFFKELNKTFATLEKILRKSQKYVSKISNKLRRPHGIPENHKPEAVDITHRVCQKLLLAHIFDFQARGIQTNIKVYHWEINKNVVLTAESWSTFSHLDSPGFSKNKKLSHVNSRNQKNSIPLKIS